MQYGKLKLLKKIAQITHLDGASTLCTHAQSWAKLIAQLKRHEGSYKNKEKKHICYKCTAGKLTIGYGHNLDALPIDGIGEDSVMTEMEANVLLNKDTKDVYLQVLTAIPCAENLDFGRCAVLVNMAFNMGTKNLCGFRKTLEALNSDAEDKYIVAARHMLDSKWAVQVGQRANELAEQMITGEWV